MPKKSFTLESNFYTPEYVHEAIEAFWEDFSLSYEDNILTITAESDDLIHEIFHEFINYVTGLYNESI